jgi:hypothetical protein
MTMAAFTDAAATWIAAGVVPLPLGGVDGKRPLVSHPAKLGRRAALDIAGRPQFADAPGLGFWCGERNGLTVLDIDSSTDSELQYAIDTYGDSPVIVRTASNKAHLYFRHNGERRRIRPDRAHDIDILGEGGFAVAPPSARPAGGRYRFERGGLADFSRLPTIKRSAIAQFEPVTVPQTRKPARGTDEVVANIGQRNNTMFRLACALAQTAEDRDVLLVQMRAANAAQAVPLPDDELQRAVGSAWRYREQGSLMVPGVAESSLILPASIAEHAMATGNLDVAGLMMMVRKYHSEPGKSFALSPVAMAAANKIKGWSPNRYRYAIREAMNLGLLVLVHMGGRGKRDPSLYQCATALRVR